MDCADFIYKKNLIVQIEESFEKKSEEKFSQNHQKVKIYVSCIS